MSSRLGNTGEVITGRQIYLRGWYLECRLIKGCFISHNTIRSNYRQVVFSITLNFPLVFTQDGLPELGSSFKEIFLVAPCEKNQKLIIFHPILHQDFRGLLENIFRWHIWIPDEISFRLIGCTIYFSKEIKFSIF